jgi:prephenate dehydrogenase
MINQLTILGLGFVGQSIARAIRSAYFANSIVGYDEDPRNARSLLEEDLIDHYQNDLVGAIKNADLIIITLPYSRYETLFSQLHDHLKESVTITEIASIKRPILSLAKNCLGKFFPQFVPSHPIMSLNVGHDAPMPDIFAERPIFITATEETNPDSISLVTLFWQKMGGEIEFKTAAENDAILATVSHLPQILAFTFITTIKEDDTALRYITPNFIDFTSIATESPAVWSNICIANRVAILKELAKFESKLKNLKELLESENTDILREHFSYAKQLRESI